MGEILTKILSMIENLLIIPLIWMFPIKWAVIQPGSTGVRFTLGRPSKDFYTGIHFATTGQTITKMHTAVKPTTADAMYVLTADGLSLRVRGVVLYTVTNLSKFLTCSEDSEQLMIDMCEAAIKSVISRTAFESLICEAEEVEKKVASTLGEIGRSTGVKIKRYRFQDIEIVDPVARAMSSCAAMACGLITSSKKLASEGGVSLQEALRILSPNVIYTIDVMSRQQLCQDVMSETLEVDE